MKRDCLERLAKIKNKKSIIKTINFTNKFWREILIKSKRLKIRKCKITWAHRFWALKSSNKKFILNKILFRGGNYSLSFIYTKSGDPSDYYKLSKKFDFYFDNKIFELNYSNENAYGSIIYPNTL